MARVAHGLVAPRNEKAARVRGGSGRLRRWVRFVLIALAVLAAAVVWKSAARAQDGSGGDEGCLACHGEGTVLPEESPHAFFECADCHAGLDPEEIPHADPMPSVDCASCHADADEAWRTSEHGRAAADGVAEAPGCIACHAKPVTDSRLAVAHGVEPGEAGRGATKIAQERLCLSCHLDDSSVRARMTPAAGFIAAYEASIHGAALHGGNDEAANCVDCHGFHDVRRGVDPASRVARPHLPQTCGTCHAEIAAEYATSSHAVAARRGVRDAPVCTDCHGEHDILSHGDSRSPVAPENVSRQVCAPCHESVRLAGKYGLPASRPASYATSYHGLATRGGDLEAANCASCHGAHAILPSSDPASTVHPANIAATCGTCHPGANERFASGPVHVIVSRAEHPLLFWISTAYLVLIVLVVGGMTVHHGLDLVRRTVRRARKDGAASARARAARPAVEHLRMTLGERLQHGILAASFTLLVVSGFMLSYPEAWWVGALRRIHPGLFDLRTFVHHFFGTVLLAAGSWHLAYVLVTARGRGIVRDMLPRRSDLAAPFGVLAYNLGLRPGKPRFGRFSYVEKIEYWAVVWGTAIMGVTGVIMWFENTSMSLFTKFGWDVARTIHFWEAWLAFLAVLVWHVYWVIFNPDVYPMNTSWITGRVPEEYLANEHPLELEAIRKQRADALRRERAARRTH